MKIIDLAIHAAQKAGRLIIKESKGKLKVDRKGHNNDLVTQVDKASEELIIKTIKSVYPKHAILGEESQVESEKTLEELMSAPYIWIIDPIDGTTNFVHGLPHFAVSIGVFKTKASKKSKNFEYLEGEMVAGVVFAPKLKELFYAEKNKGAFLNGEKIKVSQVKKVEGSLAATGFPAKNRHKNLPYFKKMLKNCQAMRRQGSASLDLAYVAAGRLDLFWEFSLNPWDIAAGALLVHEAGGKITDSYGNPLDLFGANILATNKKVHKESVKIFTEV